MRSVGVRFALWLGLWVAIPVPATAQDAYVPNQGSDDLTVFAVHDPTDRVTLSLGNQPHEAVAGLNGRYIFVTNRLDDDVAVFDATTRTEVDTDGDPGNGVTRIAVGSQPHGLALTPDNRYLFVSNDGSNDVSVVDTASLAVVSTVPEVGLAPHMVAVRPDGKEAWVGNIAGGDVSLIDVHKAIDDPSNAVICIVPGGSGPQCRIATGAGTEGVAFTHDGRTAYAANGGANTVSVIDVAGRTVTATLPVAGSPRRVHVSHGGRRAYVSQLFGNQVVVIDTATNQLLAEETIEDVPNGLGMDFRADDALLYVSNFFSSTVTVIELADTTQRQSVPAGLNPDSVAIQREEVRALRFGSDKQTLTWSRQFLADSYNVYRGSVSSLPDYGACLNAGDPDLTDTSFPDTDLPTAGDGFTYLISITSGDREGILGYASAGSLREPQLSCLP